MTQEGEEVREEISISERYDYWGCQRGRAYIYIRNRLWTRSTSYITYITCSDGKKAKPRRVRLCVSHLADIV